jgi:hypothetical protein
MGGMIYQPNGHLIDHLMEVHDLDANVDMARLMNDAFVMVDHIAGSAQHNPFVTTLALGLRPKQRGLQGCRPRRSPGVTSHAPESVGKCEGMNPHTPKATPTLGDEVPMDS